jgi:pyruvyltransferase
MIRLFLSFILTLLITPFLFSEGLPLYYWRQDTFVNFGDHISLKLVERIVQQSVVAYRRKPSNNEKKLLAIGSILSFADDYDVIWGTGVNGKLDNKNAYHFTRLDIRAVRGPITRTFLQDNFQIECPEVYGDPGLLIPYFFPEFKKKQKPQKQYVLIPHYSEIHLFPKSKYKNVVYPTEPWDVVIKSILNSQFVISSSLHGIVIAEAYGIPARMIRVTENEPLLKYYDYYMGTNRPNFCYATSIEEALKMGGEPPFECDLKKLYYSFPFEFWPHTTFINPNFK